MKFEVINGVIHIDGKPTESEMEIGIAIKKSINEFQPQIEKYFYNAERLMDLISLRREAEMAINWFNRKAKEKPAIQGLTCTFPVLDADYMPNHRVINIMMDMTQRYIESMSVSQNWKTVETVNDLPNPKDHAAVFVQWNNETILIELKSSTPKVMLNEFNSKGFRKWHPLIYPKR